MQVRTVGTLLFCSIALAAGSNASTALAANTGGAAATAPKRSAAIPAPAAKPKVHTFRVTSRSRSVAYKGPVYVRTASGEVIPFAAGVSTGSVASVTATGGAAPAGAPVPAASTPVTPLAGELTSGDGMTSATGPVVRPELLVPGSTARFVSGIAAAPMNAPAAVQQIIWAGNELIGLPYIYGGGHASFVARGYDCSGTVSYALHGASLLSVPEDSSEMETWGSHGPGRWVAVFANPGHAYMAVAGLRLDTSAADDPAGLQGPRWRPLRTGNAGYRVRHPLGL